MPDHRYLFVDGGYLRVRHAEAMKSVFGEIADLQLHLQDLRTIFSPQAQRCYYYDSLHDLLKADEAEEELKERVATQLRFFDEIQSYEGFHVRLGSMSGNSRKFRQKEVDILLAVDAMDHAFRRNMATVILIAGDLDFAPLVESLVRLGIWVEIWYDPRSVGKRLLEVADKVTPITFHDYYNRCHPDFKVSHPLPTKSNQIPDVQGEAYELLKAGWTGTQPVRLFKHDNEHLFIVDADAPWLLQHQDQAVVENYFAVVYDKVEWAED